MASSSNPPTTSMIKRNATAISIKKNPNRGGGDPSKKIIRIKSETNNDSKSFATERLSSFRLPRDLTLGGIPSARASTRPNLISNNKKVYMPNLNAVRNKNVDVKTSRDTTITNSRGRGRGGRTERGARGGSTSSRNSLVTSSGLFSEGAGDGTSKRLMSRFRNTTDSGESAATLKRPTIVKKEKVDPTIEQKHIREIYDLDDDLMDEDRSSSSDSFTPINLMEIKPELKLENRFNGIDIKDEPSTETATATATATKLSYPNSIQEFFNRTAPQLFLIQLPDALPGHGPVQEPAESAEHERPISPDPQLSYCTMSQLDEGRIGRLVRYRSGKTKLILGESQFDIDMGIDPGLLQEVISLATNSTERSGNMINLGQIGAKFSAIPDWEFMLQKNNTEKS